MMNSSSNVAFQGRYYLKFDKSFNRSSFSNEMCSALRVGEFDTLKDSFLRMSDNNVDITTTGTPLQDLSSLKRAFSWAVPKKMLKEITDLFEERFMNAAKGNENNPDANFEIDMTDVHIPGMFERAANGLKGLFGKS